METGPALEPGLFALPYVGGGLFAAARASQQSR